MNNPIVSVVIPTYNRAHCLKEAIDSVLSQTFQDFELIVVDDGSTDGTCEIVKAYGDRINLIRQENCGVSSARNAGIRAAKGEWIAFLDSDDTWEPDKLKIQLDDLLARPDAVAHMVDARIIVSGCERFSLFKMRGMYDDFMRRPFRKRPLCDVFTAYFYTQASIIRKKSIEAVGYFNTDLNIHEDTDLLARLAMNGPFMINCYIGANIRRISGSYALSELHKDDRLKSLHNILHIYNNLKKDSRLNVEERRNVHRSIGGVLCEIATQHRSQGNYYLALVVLLRSIAEEPGLRSVARAIMYAVGSQDLIGQLAPWRKKSDFRRSELNREKKRT